MEKLSNQALLLRYSNGKRDFSKLDLQGISLFEKVLRNANFSDCNLRNAYLPYSQLNEAIFCNADLTGSDLAGVQLYQADFTGANLSQANLLRANLRRANLSGADLSGAMLNCADLREANLTNANLTGATITGVEATGAIFDGATLSYCNFFRSTGVDLSQTQWDDTVTQADGYRGKPQ